MTYFSQDEVFSFSCHLKVISRASHLGLLFFSPPFVLTIGSQRSII